MQGANPKKKKASKLPTAVRFTTFERIEQLKEGEISLNEIAVLSGVLDGIFFYLNGIFDDKDAVMSTISNMGGEIKGRMSKNISK